MKTTSLIALLLAATTFSARAAGPPPAEVEKSIARATAYLYSIQKNGTWEIQDQGEESATGRHRGGLTALAAYALVAAGENPQDPRLAKAIAWLKTADIVSVYALGCRAQLWNLLPPSKE